MMSRRALWGVEAEPSAAAGAKNGDRGERKRFLAAPRLGRLVEGCPWLLLELDLPFGQEPDELVVREALDEQLLDGGATGSGELRFSLLSSAETDQGVRCRVQVLLPVRGECCRQEWADAVWPGEARFAARALRLQQPKTDSGRLSEGPVLVASALAPAGPVARDDSGKPELSGVAGGGEWGWALAAAEGWVAFGRERFSEGVSEAEVRQRFVALATWHLGEQAAATARLELASAWGWSEAEERQAWQLWAAHPQARDLNILNPVAQRRNGARRSRHRALRAIAVLALFTSLAAIPFWQMTRTARAELAEARQRNSAVLDRIAARDSLRSRLELLRGDVLARSELAGLYPDWPGVLGGLSVAMPGGARVTSLLAQASDTARVRMEAAGGIGLCAPAALMLRVEAMGWESLDSLRSAWGNLPGMRIEWGEGQQAGDGIVNVSLRLEACP
jgi:hypothetical protein